MIHRSLYRITPDEAAYGLTPDVAHLMEFEFWETILVLNYKTQFPESRGIYGNMTGPNLETYYTSIISLCPLLTAVLLSELNNIEKRTDKIINT